MKKLIIALMACSLVAGGWAEGGWGANDEPGGGGGFYRVCNNGWTYVYYGGSWGWRPDGTTC